MGSRDQYCRSSQRERWERPVFLQELSPLLLWLITVFQLQDSDNPLNSLAMHSSCIHHTTATHQPTYVCITCTIYIQIKSEWHIWYKYTGCGYLCIVIMLHIFPFLNILQLHLRGLHMFSGKHYWHFYVFPMSDLTVHTSLEACRNIYHCSYTSIGRILCIL